jgi:hypothetical protein
MSEAQRADEDIEMTDVELESDSDDYEVVDDEETRTNVRDSEDDESDGDSEDDLRQYSKNVQNRIRKLTAARRQAEEEAQAAVQYLRHMQQENEQYKQRLSTLDKGYMNEYESRISTQEQQAKRALAEAYEAGDYDRVADAQSAIAQLAIEKERLRLQKQRAEQSQQQSAQQQQVAQQPQQRQAPQRDPKLDSWLEKNQWFGKDRVMTGAARAIHETLVAEEGYDPTTDEYYQEIDRRMRREMPHKFQGDKKSVQSVTPAGSGNRAVKNGRKKSVELTPGQVAFAQKMKIPLDKYAAEVAKIQNRRD